MHRNTDRVVGDSPSRANDESVMRRVTVWLPVVDPGYARKGEATRLNKGVTMLITTLPVASAASVLPKTTARPPVPKIVRLPLAWAVLFMPTTEATVKLPGAVGLVLPPKAVLPAPNASAKLEVPLTA